MVDLFKKRGVPKMPNPVPLPDIPESFTKGDVKFTAIDDPIGFSTAQLIEIIKLWELRSFIPGAIQIDCYLLSIAELKRRLEKLKPESK